MSKTTSNKESISDLFKTEASEWLDPAEGEEGQWLSFSRPEEKPLLPEAGQAAEEELRTYWRSLRTFFRTGKGGGLPCDQDELQAFPALLAPFRGGRFTQRDYPCWIADHATAASGFFALPDFLQHQLDRLTAEAGEQPILQENLLRLESIIRQKLSFVDEAFKAFPVLEESVIELEAQLSVSGEEGKQFAETLKRFRRLLPKEGVLIPFSPNAAMHLLSIIVQNQVKEARHSLKEQLLQIRHQLNDILQVEKDKTSEAHSPEHLQSSMGFANDFLNFDELASVLPSGASQAIPEERYERIEAVLKTLDKADELLFDRQASICYSPSERTADEVDWNHSFPNFSIHLAKAGHLSKIATATFEEVMAKAAELFAAIRIGEIEVNNNYSAEIHTDFFNHFSWQHFDEEEMAACPPVLILADWKQIQQGELDQFSRLLASSRPVKFLIEQLGCEGITAGGMVFRQELGALAIAHRNTFVLQSAIVKPDYLYEGMKRGLQAPAPAIFYLLSPLAGKDNSPSTDLWASAAIEGREFPSFVFDSQQGPKWGNRFDIQNNPAPESDWPEHTLAVLHKEEDTILKLTFTFADFAAQDQRFSAYFDLVPPQFWSEDLIPLSEYLKGDGAALLSKVPFIWMLNQDQKLVRAAVAWPLVQICQERLDFWHYLQENAGVHSYHVEKATEQLRQKLQNSMEEKVSAMEAAFEKELANAKEESARQAMEQLARVLLDLDTDAVLTSQLTREAPENPVSTQEEKTTTKEVEAEIEDLSAPEPEAEQEEELSLGEAWIDTPLCTSCNECIDTNSKVFQYNAEKQAFVADPAGGPFADIVKAAENCPVRIIHPGAPQNPDEANLEEWVKRAEPFQ
jgi:ferredoxin